MTTEDEFQAMLNANPDDWQTRVIFADWLDERNDPRAAGYRALGALRRVPLKTLYDWYFQFDPVPGNRLAVSRPWVLPIDWYKKLPQGVAQMWPKTRRATEDMVDLALAKLKPKRRAYLIAGAGA